VKDVGAALAAGVSAPVRRWRLVLVLWLLRLLPIFVFFTLPLHEAARGQLDHHPDARSLLDASGDESGFVWAWTSDFFRGAGAEAAEKLFWLACALWLLVTVVSGGIVARLTGTGRMSFLGACGQYAGRFLRLALICIVLALALDIALNALLAEAHTAAGRMEHEQAYAVQKTYVRGALYVALLFVLGAVQGYARIDIVVHERRSAALSLLRGAGTLLARFPKLFLVEMGMLLATGAGLLVALMLMRSVALLGPGATSATLLTFVLLAAVASWIRTGLEVGTVAARCRLLAPPRSGGAAVSPFETPVLPVPAEPDAYDLPQP